MIYIHLTALSAILLFAGLYILSTNRNQYEISRFSVFLLLGAGLLLRIFFAMSNVGFGNDTACFSAWADRMFTVGPGEFYSSDFFTDYPPGFMYVLYIIGAIRSVFRIATYSGVHLLLLKLPSIVCDLVSGYLLYREGLRTLRPQKALLLAAAYLFNPAIILNSSLWGQVDSVFTLTVVCMCLSLMRSKMLPAYLSFGIGVLLKPQTLVFTPVLLAGILDYVFLQDFHYKKLLRNLAQGMAVILGMVLLSLPFGLKNVLSQYIDTLGSYPYVAVNAYNFWGLLGFNWTSQDNTFLFLSFRQWGSLVIVLIVVFTFVISLRMRKDNTKYPLLGAFIILTMFLFSVRMHERYMYPGLILLLLCCLYKSGKALYLCYTGFSILHLYNTAHVLFHYAPANYNAKAPIILLVSCGMVICIGFLYSIIIRLCKGHGTSVRNNTFLTATRTTPNQATGHGQFKTRGLPPQASATHLPFTRLDAILMAVITLIYSGFALYDLGDKTAPVTTYEVQQNESILLDFGENQSPATLSYYIAPWQDRSFTLEGKANAEEEWQPLGEITLENVFTWQDIVLVTQDNENPLRYLKLTLNDYHASLLDFTFLDASGNALIPINASEYATLFDENELHPSDSTFRNSMYFDEIYHGRTAYEFVNGLQTYENTHPPLGKILIALGVALFGMNPFGWRIVGTLFGIAMLPFIYLFGKRMTNNTPSAALACVLLGFDFMHFAQTRIATIDVYITFFVIVMYYFMYQYCSMSFYGTSLKRTLLPLGACGVAFGLGFACKWSGAYAGIGLAILFFATLLRRYLEYRYALHRPLGNTNGISHADIIAKFVPYTRKTIGFCLVFFVTIPFLIYLLSYLPFVDYDATGLLDKMLRNQTTMLSYHSQLNATHPYSSSWQEWPFIVRPIWYYSNVVSSTLREGISSFGNPLVWWMGIPAFLYTLYLSVREKDNRTARFLVIGYLAQYLPWVFITRLTFIYHYFPCVPFVVYMIVFCLIQLKKKVSDRTFLALIIIYGILVFALFLLFYPVLSGQPVESDFVTKYLRWFDSWVLVAR